MNVAKQTHAHHSSDTVEKTQKAYTRSEDSFCLSCRQNKSKEVPFSHKLRLQIDDHEMLQIQTYVAIQCFFF